MSGYKIKLPRRRFLQVGGLLTAGVAAYSYHRGIRFPTISLEPAGLSQTLVVGDANIQLDNLLAYADEEKVVSLRAFAPEPALIIKTTSDTELAFTVYNLATDAVLEFDDSQSIDEEIQGTMRRLVIKTKPGAAIKLRWRLPPLGSYTFAAIGDSGGDKELAWCLKRAHQLGARFLLHLGDFNYQQGDYENAISQFNNAPLPCYVSIGNHDFHDSGLVHEQFLTRIGPLNQQFSIGDTRFVNFDTAASFLPYSGGLRGELFSAMLADKTPYADTVAFSHRPLHDPQQDGDHDIGNTGERDWIIGMLKQTNIKSLLSGHIHIFNRSEVQGIDNIIVGQGLGHQDLIVQGDHSKMAIGQVDELGKVSYEFAPLAMPMELHCHPRTENVKMTLRNGPQADLIKRVDSACG